MGWSGDELPPHRKGRAVVGSNRRVVDSLGFSLSWVTKLCFTLATFGIALSVCYVARESFSVALFYPRTVVSYQNQRNYLTAGQDNYEPRRPSSRQVMSSQGDSSSRADEEEKGIRVKKFGPVTFVESIPLKDEEYIEDFIALPDGLDLLLVRQFSDSTLRDRVTACRYGQAQTFSKIINADFLDGRLAVTCLRPEEYARGNISVTDLTIDVEDLHTLKARMEYSAPVKWDSPLVYSVVATKEDVVVFVKGVFERRKLGDYSNLGSFRCVFGRGIETEVIAGSQEVFRCARPKFTPSDATRQKVYLRYRGHLIPSVAYYEWSKPARGMGPKHLICSCTMIWNAAKFLREWILFNSHLGVEKFFLYDNNSDDDIQSVVGLLHLYNVSRHFWPWVKTQEAGFSHCAVRAQKECVWVLFADVDEYIFPKKWLPKALDPALAPRSVAQPLPIDSLKRLIQDARGKVILKTKLMRPKVEAKQTLGQVSVFCRNFGPSGLTEHPAQGVTQGYTCREQREQRHKSLVLLDALTPSLANVIHHFDLKPEFMTMYVDPRKAVINHYKFQAWPEFVTKFTRRASTYVADWKEQVNLKSRDRPDGVGPDGVKPEDWEQSHCYMNDTAIRDYIRSVFMVKQGGDAGKLDWELL